VAAVHSICQLQKLYKQNTVVTEMLPDNLLLVVYQDAIGNASMLLIQCFQQRYSCLRQWKLNPHLKIHCAYIAVQT